MKPLCLDSCLPAAPHLSGARSAFCRGRTRGFALVVALSLMSFVLLLLLSLVTFVQVGSREANSQIEALAARQNALLGLQVALGTLQSEMGPDKRISASASLLDTVPESRVIDGVAEPRWTGTYDSENWTTFLGRTDPLPDFADRADHFRRWLVSGQRRSGAPRADPLTFGAGGGDEAVVIVGAGSVGTRADLPGETVRVPAVDLEAASSRTSRFAWWVGDEGQKANLNPPGEPELTGFIGDVFGLSANHRPSLGTVHTLGAGVLPGRDFTGVRIGPDEDKRLVGRSTLPQSLQNSRGGRLSPEDGDAVQVKEAYHDFTVYSRGVLTDVQEGGLKHDLNLLLGGEALPNSHRGAPIFEARSGGVDYGPVWDLLYRHYNWFKGLQVSGRNKSTSINDRTHFDSRGKGRRFYNYEEDDLKYFLQPVITKVQYIFGVFVKKSDRRLAEEGFANYNKDNNPNLIHLMCYPVVTLWNPYNVSLRTDKIMWDLFTPPLELTWNVNGQIHNISLQEAFTMPANEWTGTSFSLFNSGNAQGIGRLIDIWTKKERRSPACELRPGETRVYTPERIPLSDVRKRHLHGDDYEYRGVDPVSGKKIYESIFFNFGGSGSDKHRKGVSFDMIPGWDEPGTSNNEGINVGIYTDILSRENSGRLRSLFPGIGDLDGQFQGFAPIIHSRNSSDPDGNPNDSNSINTVTVRLMSEKPKVPHQLAFFIENCVQQYSRLTGSKELSDGDVDDWVHYLGEIGIRCSMNTLRSMFKGLQKPITLEFSEGTLTTPTPLFAVNFKLKNLNNPANPMPYSLYGDVTDNFQRVEAETNASAAALFNYEFEFFDIGSWSDSPLVEVNTDNTGFTGTGDTALSGVSYHAMREVPTAPVLSLAQLQHAPLGRDYNAPRYEPSGANISATFESYMKPHSSTGRSRPNYPSRHEERSFGNGATFAYAVGNSMAHPMIPPGSVLNRGGPQADLSYFLNDALWDRYFFSSIVPTDININDRGGKSALRVLEAAEAGAPLPNPAMEPVEEGSLTRALRTLFGASTIARDGYRRAAEYLMVRGAFNVNSTSVEAWAALLSGAFGRGVSVLEPVANRLSENRRTSIDGAAINGVPFSRFTVPNNPMPVDSYSDKDSDAAKQSAWNGFRVLSEGQINALAEAIVAEVKKRGPFLSLAEFVNRRPSDDPELALSGPIQSALDAVDSGSDPVNADLPGADQTMRGSDASRFAFPEAAAQPISKGAPGWLMQADVLTPLGPLLSARSDTFVLRGYGDSGGLGGRTSAVCEMVVQRTPEYAYAAVNEPTAEPDELDALNEAFGRRFKVVDFRWLEQP